MAGNKVIRAILVWKNRRFRGEPLLGDDMSIFDVVPGNADTAHVYHYFNPLNWLEPLGIYWVGLWPFYEVFRYDFDWTEEEIADDGKIVPVTRHATRDSEEGPTQLIYVKDVNYFILAENIKTASKVPLNLLLLLTIRIVNPYKALFRGANWLERTGAGVTNMANLYAGVLSYEDVVAGAPATISLYENGEYRRVTRNSLEDFIKSLSDGEPDDPQGTDLLKDYGVMIVAAKLHHYDFADEKGREQYRTAAMARYIKEQEGEAAVVFAEKQIKVAEKEAEAIAIRASAEAGRIDTVYGKIAGDDKDARMDIRRLEALEGSGNQGAKTIVVPDSLLGLAKRFLN
jgi:regulator of protease activity HflC (stomatin/prohibitin superfamily)